MTQTLQRWRARKTFRNYRCEFFLSSAGFASREEVDAAVAATLQKVDDLVQGAASLEQVAQAVFTHSPHSCVEVEVVDQSGNGFQVVREL